MSDTQKRLVELIGKTCRIETMEGGVRVEKVTGVFERRVQLDGEAASYVTTLFFGVGEVDGIEMSSVRKIDTVSR